MSDNAPPMPLTIVLPMLRLAPALLVLLAACATEGTPPPPSPCSGACRTHDEGYQWALHSSLTDPSICENPAYGHDFVLGCKDAVNDYSELRPASSGI